VLLLSPVCPHWRL